MNTNLPKYTFFAQCEKVSPKRSQTNNKHQGNFQGKIITPVVASTGIWCFTTFQLILDVVSVRDSEHLAAARGGRSALHIISENLEQENNLPPSLPRFQTFKGSLPSLGQGNVAEREREKVALSPCHYGPLCAFSAWRLSRGIPILEFCRWGNRGMSDLAQITC